MERPLAATDAPPEAAAEGLVQDLARGRLVEVRLQGRTASDAEIRSMPAEVAHVAYALSARPRPERHVDLLLDVPEGRRPVSLVWGQRVLAVSWTPPTSSIGTDAEAGPALRQVIARRFGIGGLVDGDRHWTDREARLADRALAAVEPEVLPLLQGMPFLRQGASPRVASRELAWFDPSGEPPVVEVYDLAFADGPGAVGPLDQLQPLAVMTLVHELGHVIADAPLRRAWLAAARDPALRDELRALGRDGPVIDAWRDVRDQRSPTPYGRRDAHESFAEAYALARLDPDALAEVMPEAAAWFAAGGHLQAAGLNPRSR